MDPSALLEFYKWALGVAVVVIMALAGALYRHIREDVRVYARVAKIEGRLGINGK